MIVLIISCTHPQDAFRPCMAINFCISTDVTVSLNQNSAVFSDSNEEFERICHYTG